ncbi:hypothetical protein XENORESO_020959 [Xenotaenia resolanae]|uniref:Uncharacterized protein n=1 Tax=Xenotaenia resolanae TaxID=208358 RepID=A0ABV0WBS1_9TELE
MPISSSLWAGGGVHPGEVASPSQGNTQATMHTLIHTPKGNLKRPINLTGMSWTVGGSQSTRREPTHANSMQKDPYPGVEPRTFLLRGNSATNCVSCCICVFVKKLHPFSC